MILYTAKQIKNLNKDIELFKQVHPVTHLVEQGGCNTCTNCGAQLKCGL